MMFEFFLRCSRFVEPTDNVSMSLMRYAIDD